MSDWPLHLLTRFRCGALSALLFTAAGGVRAAAARPGTPTIVLEAHVGQRSPEAAAAIAPVLDELERHGFAVRPDSIRQLLRGRAPLPGRLDAGKTIGDIKRLIAVGRSAFDKGLLEKSEAALRDAVGLIRRNPALLVLDTNNEKVTYNALVSLAMTLAKRGNVTEASSVMLDLLRVSNAPIPQGDYGPKAQDLHNDAEKQAQAMGRGSLAITVSDSSAMIFVDYTYRGIGRVAIGDQLPGPHHILAQVPGTVGLQYTREVKASASSTLDINWQVESALHLDGLWAGFLLATDAERTRQSSVATELGRRFDGEDVIVVSLQKIEGVDFVGGIQYPANGDEPIGALVPVNGGEALLRSLGTFLYNGTMSAGLRVLHHPLKAEAPADGLLGLRGSNTEHSTWTTAWLPPAVVGAGALTILGATLAYRRTSYDPSNPPSDGTDGRNPVVGIMLGGSLLAGGGVYLWSRNAVSADRLAAGALGAGAASIAAGVELYLVDQDPGYTLPRSVRNTATAGVIAGAAGIALVGTGIWLLRRDRDPSVTVDATVPRRSAPLASWAPFATAGSSQALLGCTGTF